MNNNLKNNYLKLIICFALLFQTINFGFSQSVLFEAASASNLLITGTSSLHDWQMEASINNCKIEASSYLEDEDLSLTSIEFQIPVVQLKSEHKKMDAIAQKALKANSFPLIRFYSDAFQPILLNDTTKKSPVHGTLEIAGIQKEVVINVLSEENSSSTLKFEFTVPINMEDYGVNPPSFMFGAVTTGSQVLVSFELYFNKLIK